jgi:hypothetical protein
MNKKLTLSLDDVIIERAKKYASDKRESLSVMVENYFRLVTSNYKKEEKIFSPIVKELLGSIKVPNDFDYENAKYDYLKEKYLND